MVQTKTQRRAAAKKAVRTRKRNTAEKARKAAARKGESVQLVKNLEEKQKEDLRDDNSPLFLIHI